MKHVTLIVTCLLLVLIVVACNTPTPTPAPTATPPAKVVPPGKAPARTPIAKTGGKVPQGNLPPAAAQPKAAASSSSSAAKSVCPALAAPQTKSSGYIKSLTMAEGYDNGEPVNPTNVFKPSSTFHVVLEIQNMPAKTVLKALWYVNDIGDAAYCNKKTGEFEWNTSSAGSGDVYFFHEAQSTWPPGTYRVEIYVNNVLDQIANFSVR